MLGINSNINSLVAQQNLTGSGSALSQAITRLSSGKRINSAADDAAGLAISNIMQTQINGLGQGVSNSNDGVSIVQTASSGLSSLTSSLQRIRQLATQAANGSMTDTDRQALQQEVTQQISEVNRIASQTTYNGMNVLDGSMGNVSFQVGANVGQSIGLNLSQNMSAAQLGGGKPQAGNTLGSFTVSLDATGKAVSNTLTETLTPALTAVGAVTASPGNATSASAISDATSSYDGGKFTVTDDGAGNITATVAGATTAANDSDTFTYSAGTGTWTAGGSNAGTLNANDTAALNTLRTQATASATQANPGLSIPAMTATLGANGAMTYTVASGADAGKAVTDQTAINAFNAAANTNGDALPSNTPATTSINVLSDGNGQFKLTDQNNQALSVAAATQMFKSDTNITVTNDGNGNALISGTTAISGSELANDLNTASGATGKVAADNTKSGSAIDTLNTVEQVSNIDISTASGASAAMLAIDNALSNVNDLQATLGAAQNRFSAIAATQQDQSTDLSTAQSSIQDANFAQETANLSKAQVLQQAGISVLAQANSQPQQILKLLQ